MTHGLTMIKKPTDAEISETIYDRIKRHEGLRLKPYRDTTGNLTIGFGHRIDPDHAPMYEKGISEDTAEHLLYADVALARQRVESLLTWIGQLDRVRQDVLVELAFQVGAGGLLDFHDMLYRLRSGDYGGAAKALLDSELHRQTPARCEELAGLLLEGASLKEG